MIYMSQFFNTVGEQFILQVHKKYSLLKLDEEVTFFSSSDFFSGYWQVPIDLESTKMTAF